MKISLGKIPNDIKIALVALLMIIAAAIISPHFLEPANIRSLLLQVSPLGIIAVGMTFVIITAGIDLSVGSQVAMISVLMAGNGTLSMPMMISLALVIGLIAGTSNGFLIGSAQISPFITTLATMAIFKGVALFVSNSEERRIVDSDFSSIATTDFLGLPLPVWLFFLAVVIGQIVLKRSVFGLRVAAVGSNFEAARFAGIDVDKIRTAVYIISGVLCGASSLLVSSRLSTATPTLGDFYELDAIAAVIIGGTSLFGGRGSVVGTFFGILIFGVITNVLNLSGASPHVQRIAKGLVILAAVYFQSEQFAQIIRGRKK